MTNNLFIQAFTEPSGVVDSGVRPLPPGVNFWSAPGVVLYTGPGGTAVDASTYVPNNAECPIQVFVHDNYAHVDEQIPYLFVEVWVCDPATIVGPDAGLKVAQGSSTTTLTANSTSSGFVTPILVGGFDPYPGMSTQPGGHACLFANVYGSKNASGSPITDGQSLIGSSANIPNLVQADGHVAQHNIFAKAMTGSSKRHLSFPFKAVAALRKGEEKVTLEIRNTTEDGGLTENDLAFLRTGPFKPLQLHPSKIPLTAFAIEGLPGGPAKSASLELQAGHPLPLGILVETGPGEHQGAVHTFNVTQRNQAGQVQGGIRLLAITN